MQDSIVVFALLMVAVSSAPHSAQAIDIGSRRELVIDECADHRGKPPW